MQRFAEWIVGMIDMRVAGLAMAVLMMAGAVPAADVSVRNGVVLLPSDESIAPFDRPFNLTGRSLTFTPNPSGTFAVEIGPLQFDDQRGARLAVDAASKSAAYSIAGFDFPFLGDKIRKLYISQLLGIYLDPPPAPYPFSFAQYGDAETIVHTAGRRVIAPLLTSTKSQGGTFRPPEVWVREGADRVVVTWWQEARALAVQAVLFANGTIRFSYRDIATTRGGVLIITTGAEAWRTPTPIATAADPLDDVVGSLPAERKAMLDIVETSLQRVGITDVLRLAIKVRAAIDRAKLAAGEFIGIQIGFGGPPTVSGSIAANDTSDYLFVRSFQTVGPSPALQIEGDTIVLTLSQAQALPGNAMDGDVEVTLYDGSGADTLRFHAGIDAAPRPLRTDFAGISAVASLAGPIADAFTIPALNDAAAWERVRGALNLDPTAIDAVAVYQNFYTAVVFQSGAYSVPGNPGVDGIYTGTPPPSTRPRAPNLLNLSRIGVSQNAIDDFAASVAMHELGHRWLFGIRALDDAGNPVVLGDTSGHPLHELDTRAAFPVLHPYDCSVMGGFTFTDNGDGTFSAAGIQEDGCLYGYSWLDLYAMGLADASEVPPFFYLSDAQPAVTETNLLKGPVRANRHDLTIGNVIARLGPRKPAWPDTQRVFRVLFVLLYDSSQPVPAADVAAVAHYANLVKSRFAIATGYRGSIDTVFPIAAPRRRAAGK